MTGPTAVGKSDLALSVVKTNSKFKIVNADSKQVYQELPILTAQPNAEIVKIYDCYLYGYISIITQYSVVKWLKDIKAVLDSLWKSGNTPLLVGGSPLYIYSFLNGIHILPELTIDTIHSIKKKYDEFGKIEFLKHIKDEYQISSQDLPSDTYRLLRNCGYLHQEKKTIESLRMEAELIKPEYDNIKILAFIPDREIIYSNIDKRFTHVVQNGAIEEVQNIMNYDITHNKAAQTIHGLPELMNYLNGNITIETAIEIAQKNIRHYAKRQITWFKNKFKEIKIFSEQEAILQYIKNNHE